MFSSLPLFSLTHPPKQAISVSAFIQPTSLIDFLSRQDGECYLCLLDISPYLKVMDGWLFLVIVLPLPPYWGCGRSSPSLEFISKYGSQWYKDENVNILLSTRFSRSTSSTLRLRLRPVSTSSRDGDTYRRLLAHHNHQGPSTDFEFFFFFLDSCAYAPLFLHGRQVPRLLHHHHRLLARPDRRRLCRLLDRPLPAHRWQGQTHGGLLFPEKVNVTLRD